MTGRPFDQDDEATVVDTASDLAAAYADRRPPFLRPTGPTTHHTTDPVAGETPELREAFKALVAEVQAGAWVSSDAMVAYLRSDASPYPARMVYFAAAAWDRARLTAPDTGAGPLVPQDIRGERQHRVRLDEASDGEALPPVDEGEQALVEQYLAAARAGRPQPLPPQSARIADGVRAVDAEASAARTAALLDGLVNLPAFAPGGPVRSTAAMYDMLSPAQRADFDRELRRSGRVAVAKAVQQYALAAILAIGAVVALVIGWGILTNGWRWWA